MNTDYSYCSTANKYPSAGHHEQENKKFFGQIKFLAVTIKQQIKLVLQHSLCKYIYCIGSSVTIAVSSTVLPI